MLFLLLFLLFLLFLLRRLLPRRMLVVYLSPLDRMPRQKRPVGKRDDARGQNRREDDVAHASVILKRVPECKTDERRGGDRDEREGSFYRKEGGGGGDLSSSSVLSSIIVLLPRQSRRASHPQPSSLVQQHIFDPFPEPIVTASRVRVRRCDGNLVQNDDDLVVPSTRQRPR